MNIETTDFCAMTSGQRADYRAEHLQRKSFFEKRSCAHRHNGGGHFLGFMI